jgi:hypothetical protein
MVKQKHQNVTVARIGHLDESEADNIIGIANLCQQLFHFSEIEDLGVDLSPYKLANGGYDLDNAVKKEVAPESYSLPLVILTSEPYAVEDRDDEPGWFYFYGEIEPRTSIISTYLWESLDSERSLQPYLLYMLGATLISIYSGLEFHEETKGCIFDFCDEPLDIDKSLKENRFFCGECQHHLNRKIASGAITQDQLIAALRLVNRARGPGLTCFISYSHKDGEFAKRLYSSMRRKNIQVWMAAKDIRVGKIHEQLEMSIKLYDKLLLVISEKSMASDWVKSEIRWAIEAGLQEKKEKLLPIRLADMDSIRRWRYFDADYGKDLAREVREYLIHDFSTWQDRKAFEKSFASLIKALM